MLLYLDKHCYIKNNTAQISPDREALMAEEAEGTQPNKGLLRRESHYYWLLFAIVAAHVTYMSHFFPREFADTSQAQLFISSVASFVPVMDGLIRKAPLYGNYWNNYWAMFYGIFWCIAPIFPLLGFISTFFFEEGKRQRLLSMSRERFLLSFFVLILSTAIVYFIPFVSNFPAPIFNQLSNNFLLLLLAWLITAGGVYSSGLALGVWYQRSKL